jgi:CRP/FNR family transcriptional regulator
MASRLEVFSSQSCSKRSQEQFGVFCSLSEEAKADFERWCRVVSLPAGAVLMREEDVVNQLFIVCSGRVKISCTSKQGKTMSLKIVGPGEIIGLSSALAGSQSEICAKTIEPCTVNVLRSNDFLAFIERYGEASLIAAYALAEECKSTFSGARSLALSGSVAGRLAGLLLEWGKTSSSTDSCGLRFNMTLTHEDLAEFTGSCRETVTRALGKFQTDSLIEIRGTTVHILDPEKLAQFSV